MSVSTLRSKTKLLLISGKLTAILEQVFYTSFSLIVFVIAITQYAPEKSALNLGVIALLNLPVPFHAIQIGWRNRSEGSFWLGSRKAQIIIFCATLISIISYMVASFVALDATLLTLVLVAGFVAVWSNGIRWVFIKRAEFTTLMAISFLSLLLFLALEFSKVFSGVLSVFVSVIVAKTFFTVALIAVSKRRAILSFKSEADDSSFDIRLSALAFSRFMRTNGVFTIMTVIAPNAALAGRLVQQMIAICRVFQNPLANHTFFHQPSFFKPMLVIQLFFGTAASIAFVLASEWFDLSSAKLLSAATIFVSTLGFIGISVLRHHDRKMLGITFETVAACALFLIAIAYHQTDGFIFGLLVSESLLFVAGLIALKSRFRK